MASIIILIIKVSMKDCSTQRFSFQYYLDLGNNKISHILISQESDPYIEASKLCAKETLPSILVTIIGDAIKDQMERQRNLVLMHQKRLVSEVSRNQSEVNCEIKVNRRGLETLNTELKDEPYQNQSFQRQKTAKSIERANIFENLYNNYKEIERKKQLSRKKSFQAIPFRPQINHLSEKIVLNKRRIEEEMNVPPETRNSKFKSNSISNNNSKSKISYRVTQMTETGRENSKDNLYHRSSIYLKKSEEKRQKLRNSIEKKLMQNCSFHPKINTRLR